MDYNNRGIKERWSFQMQILQSLRKAQHQIENLDALLKLELAEGRMPKIIGITQLTPQQREELAKRSA